MLLAVAWLTIAGTGCGEAKRPDPDEFYKVWVEGVRAGDGRKIYDALDTTLRRNLDMDIERMKGQIPQMDPEQQALWQNMQGLKGKDAYAKLLELNKDTVGSQLSADYRILKVDTVVVMTVQHADRAPNLVYMRWENGGYRITEAPRVPIELSADKPPAGGGNGAAGGGTPGGAAPAPQGNGGAAPGGR